MSEPSIETSVCVIDDDEAVNASVAAIVRALDCPVACYPTAEEFLARPDTVVPCLLIVDVRLPGMSGLELLAQLAKGTTTPAAIVMTGHADAKELSLDFWPNEICILPKPCPPEKLIELISRSTR